MTASTSDKVSEYLAQCKRINEMYKYDYVNTELEQLFSSPYWDAIEDQLNKHERRNIRGYLNYIQDTSFGYLDTQIEAIEATTERVKELHRLELNARWLILDRRTGLYWSRVIEKPYWDKKSKAFLFNKSQAEMFAKRFCKLSVWWRFQSVKIDATTRLKRSKF